MKKDDLNNLLLELYKITTAENRTVGAQMTQLASNSILGLAIIFALVTLALQLLGIGILGLIMLIIFFLFVIGLLIGFAWNYWILYQVLGIHHITTLSMEILQREIILEKKTEDDLEREIINLFPYLNLRLSKKKWFRRLLEKKGKNDLLKKLNNLNS